MRKLGFTLSSGRRAFLRAVLLLGAAIVVFSYGVGVGVYHWPPYSSMQTVNASLRRAKSTTLAHDANSYTLQTHIHSYFKRDNDGRLELRDGIPYKAEQQYLLERTFHPASSAVVIMDPWVDMADADLNTFYGRVTESHIIPLAKAAIRRGHPIIIFTNDPEKIKYDTKIHSGLEALVQAGDAVVLYHQDYDDRQFASLLRSKGIRSLIYVGFASNICVVGRPVGMIPMKYRGFDIFFVPEASAAVEFPDTWQDQSIHAATTRIMSKWIAEIIDYEMFLEALSASQ